MKPIYTGIFFDENTYKILKAKSNTKLLSKSIENPHVTLEFKPQDLLPDSLIGKEIEVTIVGEGNDEKNHGYEVVLPFELKEHYKGASKAHITMSIDYDAKPVDTGNITFKARRLFVVKGKLGYFTNSGIVYSN